MTQPVPTPVKGLAAVSLFNDVASEMVYPLLPAFVTRIGGSAAMLGLLDGAAEFTSAILKWVSGRLSDRPGLRKPLILAGYGTAVLVRPLISVASAAWQVVGFRVLDRVGKGLRTAPRDALIADVTPEGSEGRSFGLHRAADHLGAVLGSVVAWLLLAQGADVPDVIRWSLLPGLVAIAVLLVALRGTGSGSRGRGVGPNDRSASLRSSIAPSYRPMVALALFSALRMPETLILLRLQQVGLSVALVPLAWAGLHVVRSAASYPAGEWSDRVGPRRLIALAGLFAAAIMVGFGVIESAPAAVGLLLLFGLVAAVAEPAERSLVAQLDPARRGRGFGSFHGLVGLASLPAALGFGILTDARGATVAFVVSAVLLGVLTIGWVATFRE
ncbi:MAG TPA: MFS transporter [Gemmatimonadales bacterium]|nr:MFS transporter [Gemmatimonadales bacterium]